MICNNHKERKEWLKEGGNSMGKKVAYYGMFTALSMVFSYIEVLLPLHTGIPGVKIGLANLVTVLVLYSMGEKEAFFISGVRIVLTNMLFYSPGMLLFSLAGGFLSLLVMVILKKTKRFSAAGVSVAGGVAHNIGQLICAAFVIENTTVFYYFPVLLISGTLAGGAIGIVGGIVLKKLPKQEKE